MPVDLDAIKAALAAATPGPWAWDREAGAIVNPEVRALQRRIWDARPGDPLYDAEDISYTVLDCPGPSSNKTNDAHLVANAPTWLADLVAEVERLRAAVQETLDNCDCDPSMYATPGFDCVFCRTQRRAMGFTSPSPPDTRPAP